MKCAHGAWWPAFRRRRRILWNDALCRGQGVGECSGGAPAMRSSAAPGKQTYIHMHMIIYHVSVYYGSVLPGLVVLV